MGTKQKPKVFDDFEKSLNYRRSYEDGYTDTMYDSVFYEWAMSNSVPLIVASEVNSFRAGPLPAVHPPECGECRGPRCYALNVAAGSRQWLYFCCDCSRLQSSANERLSISTGTYWLLSSIQREIALWPE